MHTLKTIMLAFVSVALFFSLSAFFASEAKAVDWTIPDVQIAIPGLEFSESIECEDINDSTGAATGCKVPWIWEYIAALYKYSVGIIGIVAVIVMMIGGFIWITAGGNSARITEAKNWIGASLTGLVLMLCSYTILYYINPELIKKQYIIIGDVAGIEVGNETIQEAGTKSATPFFDCANKTYGSSPSEVSGKLTTVNFLGKNYQVNSQTAMALNKAQQEINSQGITYKSTESGGGGYNWRKNVNNPTKQSTHSFGIAIDINPTKNPNYRKTSNGESCRTNIPQGVITALKNNGFRWGGDYKSTCDSMHFEYLKGDAPCKI